MARKKQALDLGTATAGADYWQSMLTPAHEDYRDKLFRAGLEAREWVLWFQNRQVMFERRGKLLLLWCEGDWQADKVAFKFNVVLRRAFGNSWLTVGRTGNRIDWDWGDQHFGPAARWFQRNVSPIVKTEHRKKIEGLCKENNIPIGVKITLPSGEVKELVESTYFLENSLLIKTGKDYSRAAADLESEFEG